MSGLTLALDQTAVLMDQPLCNRESKARAIGTASDHREKNLVLDVFGNTRTIVDNINLDHQSVFLLAYRELAQDTGTQRDIALSAHCLARVTHNIQQGLDQKILVTFDLRNTRVIVTVQGDVPDILGQHDIAHVFKNFMYADILGFR